MPLRLSNFVALLFLAAITVIALGAEPACGQDTTGTTTDTTAASNTGGVQINAEGLLSARSRVDPTGALTMRRLNEAKVSVNRELQQPSKLRKVSLVRLEQQVKNLLDAGKSIPDDMQFLAGLTRITHVFYYPENDDVVIAGPAEGYFKTAQNEVVGMTTGKAVLQLQDLIVALRAFGPDNKTTRVISVSIDPTAEGLRRLKAATRRVGAVHPSQVMNVARMYHDELGYQTITFKGVSPKTHFAQVLVEADYNMKLIGIGVERAPKGITSFIKAATLQTGNGLQRWFFQPNYDAVTVAEDSMAMELTGSGVKLVGENESISTDGKRTRTGKASKASLAYTTSFTKSYAKLAEVNPLYGQLRNLMDLSLAAAFIQKMGLYEKAGWSLDTFGDESVASVEHFNAPEKVDAVINVVPKGGSFMTPIGGGVSIQPRVSLNADRVKVDSEGKINKVKASIDVTNLKDGQWWWD